MMLQETQRQCFILRWALPSPTTGGATFTNGLYPSVIFLTKRLCKRGLCGQSVPQRDIGSGTPLSPTERLLVIPPG